MSRHCEGTTRTGQRCLKPEAYPHSPFCYVHGHSATGIAYEEAWRVRLAREQKQDEENRRKYEAKERRRLALPELLRAARALISDHGAEVAWPHRRRADLEKALDAFGDEE